MKVQFEKYNPDWLVAFEKTKTDLLSTIGFTSPIIEHIGSTSVESLSAKPIIDILVGLTNENDLDRVIEPLVKAGYIYYEIYNKDMPYRRLFVKHKSNVQNLHMASVITADNEIPRYTEEHKQRLAHVHILAYNTEHWIRHIAFRDYLRSHPKVKEEYQHLKEILSTKEWKDGNEYSQAKNNFIKAEEQKAIHWYSNKNKY
ncbi:MAG: GrpB family protein [Bacteroidota bacterium]